jgi:hypothetical protein
LKWDCNFLSNWSLGTKDSQQTLTSEIYSSCKLHLIDSVSFFVNH